MVTVAWRAQRQCRAASLIRSGEPAGGPVERVPLQYLMQNGLVKESMLPTPTVIQ
jgi:hypothetical protein